MSWLKGQGMESVNWLGTKNRLVCKLAVMSVFRSLRRLSLTEKDLTLM